jgi:hypothetical protein
MKVIYKSDNNRKLSPILEVFDIKEENGTTYFLLYQTWSEWVWEPSRWYKPLNKKWYEFWK